MANVKNGVIGPDGKMGMQQRDIIAKVVAREEKNGTGYYMNAQLAQYGSSKAAKSNAQSQPQLASAHTFEGTDGKSKKSYDIRIGKNQYEQLIANSKNYQLDDKTTVCGFTADLMKTKENGLMPKIETAVPTTSKAFNDKAWQKQTAATQKAYEAGRTARAAAKQAGDATPAVEAEAQPEA